MNAVLQDSANACSRLLTCPSPSELWNTSPSTVTVVGQLAADDGVMPWPISAVEVSTLNVDPGGNPPRTAWLWPPALVFATASTPPGPAPPAPRDALFPAEALASAASAAFWTAGSMLVLTGVPAWPGKV